LPKKIIYHIYGVIAFAALISLCSHVAAQADASRITGSVINEYRKVTLINSRIVTFSGASVFKQKDTVLMIQMTGIQTGGTIDNTNAGRYEFHIVESAVGNTVTLKSTPGSFSTSELVQIVRVPSYKNAIIPSGNTLQCAPWSWASGTGGVLALMVDETLTLQGNIDVSGLGFNGGAVSTIYAGMCSFAPPYNSPNYQQNDANRAGNKGEGAITTSHFNPGVSPNNIRGYEKICNGGGGGNGQWSGGGGGANGGAGGSGDDQACGKAGFPISVGNNGQEVKYNEIIVLSEHAFMGGGGGAGTGIGTAGGNGGGIVILVAQKIKFEGNAAIKANGGSVPEMPGMSDNPAKPSTAGAGGGGGGGSILLSAADYGDIRVEIAGGDGGSVLRVNCVDNNADSRGAGGGGGGGFLLTTRDTSGIGHKIKIKGGVEGRIANTIGGTCGASYSGPGQNAVCRSNFQVQMKGFFRNYIMTPDTETCSGKQLTIEASQPQGGNGNFTYSWESTPMETDDWTAIPDADGKDLTCTITQSIRVRRIVTSEGIVDFSSSITITAEAPVNNTIAPAADTTLCWKESLAIRGNMPTGGGGGPYEIQWQEFKNNTWVDIDQAADLNLTASLQAGGGDQTYRRQVTSVKGCVSEGNTSVIHVQPLITNNTITPDDQKVCEDNAQKLTGPELEGGAGSYQYYWQVKTEGRDWTDLSNPDTDADCQPILNTPQITGADLYQERSYRRFVRSGTCQSQSNEVTVHFDRQSSASNIETPGDQVGSNALRFQFSEKLDAEPPAIGSGIWSSADEKLSFNPPNEPSTTVSNLQLGNNTVIWTVSNGACVSEPDSVKIEVIDITIPNGFSPNGDGINECFRIVGGENAVTGEITVLDRYNNVVFESKAFKGVGALDQCSGWWDGRTSSGKELPTGTYFYKLTLNGDKVYKGYVVLKKQ
jgi:gliding motility-associated-like protein